MTPQNFIIMYMGRYPVRLVSVVNKTFTITSLFEATPFEERQAAHNKGAAHGVHAHNLKVMTVEEAAVVLDIKNLVCPKCGKVHSPFCGVPADDCPHCEGDGHTAETCPHN